MTTRNPESAYPAYPLQVSANRRYLVDQRGVPFLVHGDTAWSLITALTREEAGQYLADRQGKRFNSLIVNLIEHKFNGPVNRYGEGPFTTPGDFTTPNEAYFAHAEWVIAQAAKHGIQVLLAPLYLGYPNQADDEGWYREVLANGPHRCRQYGRYVGQRFGRFDNLIWLMGGDRNPGAALDHVDAVVEGIRECDRRHLFTAHVLPEHSPAVEYARGGWVDLNATYTYAIVHRKLIEDYSRQPAMPFVLIESTYEGEHNASAVQVRRQAYWAVLCGATGHFFGNRPMWGFFTGWQAALDSPGAQDMVRVRALFDSRPWYDLVPDREHIVVTAGLGEFRGLDYAAAARTSDGSTVIVYIPTPRTIAVDLSQVSGDVVTGWWFDPRTGKAQPAISEIPFREEDGTRGSRELTPPGDGDWVLVLDDASKRLPAPG
jgi:hypothetical protein